MKKILIPASAIKTLSAALAALESKADRDGVPPKGAQSAAARGLELRREFGRGGTSIGVARARDISNGRNLSESTVRRMKAYFDRHEVDKQGKDWDNTERPSNGKIAWLLWGGDAGRSWATRLVERWNKEDGKTKSLPRWLPNGEEITELSQLAAVLCIDQKTAAYVVLDSSNPSEDLLSKAFTEIKGRQVRDKAAQRFVRTAAGSIFFGQPILTPIVADGISWRQMIRETVSREGGISLSLMTGTSPTTGYAVAQRGTNLEIAEAEFENEGAATKKLMDWCRKNETAFDDSKAHLGIWHDRENKEIVLDVSFVLDNLEGAIDVGKINNQQSIWDIANQNAIETGGTGDRQEKGLSNEQRRISRTSAKADIEDDGKRTRGVVRVDREGSSRKPTAAEIEREDGNWNERTGTSHYSLGRVLKEPEEKRQVRDSSYWGAPVGTPLPLPSSFRRVSTPSAREDLGIGSHGVVRAAEASRTFRAKKGLDSKRRVDFRKVSADKERAARIADAYDELPVDDESAHKAYDKLITEIDEQYEFLVNELGVDVEFIDEDPYKNSFEMMDDVENNNRLRVFKTSSTEPHPYLTNEQNDKFRAVHDYFGHAATGRGFAQDGEEAAWVSHSLMFSMEARSALTTETRGQNSWYNTRDQGFATQKVALLPSEFWEIPEDAPKPSVKDRRLKRRADRTAAQRDKKRSSPGTSDNTPANVLKVKTELSKPGEYEDFLAKCDKGGGCEDIAEAVEKTFDIPQVYGTFKTRSGKTEYHSWNQDDSGWIVDVGQDVFPAKDRDGEGALLFPPGSSQYRVEGYGVKDVYAGDRSGGVSGGVAVPFEILKPVRRQTRDRIRRMIRDREKLSKDGDENE